MGGDCEPELCLRLGRHCTSDDSDARSRFKGFGVDKLQHQQQQQQITIFYGGRICVCDVTEIQATAIICMAKGEMDERMKKKNHKHIESSPPLPLSALSQLLNPGLSMTRSLQRFLQKRRTRMEASSPYIHHGQQ